jgi:radical SAM family uncharacterized protein/radical SAM-linked protein
MNVSPQPKPHPYAAFLQRVRKPARYTGGEVGCAHKDWDAVQARVCLAFPDVYDIGMSHLGYKILYKVLNDDPRTLAERAYCPWLDMEAELRARSLPLVSVDGYHPLSEFDVVGFSLQFELTFSNILTMLDLGGIPLRASERGEDDPLVVAGGPTATHPEPVAAFFDAIVIGDGEAKLTELALCWTELKSQGRSRAERLRALAELGAIYVPSLYQVELEPDHGLEVVVEPEDATLPYPIERAMVDINDYPFPSDGPTGGPEAIFDRTSVEITRGCTEGCRFCQAGMIYRPVQERDPQQVYDTVLESLRTSGNDEVALTALSTADVSYINPLIKKLAPELGKRGISLSVSSLRAYGLEPEILDELKLVRAGGLTFAPEAGSERMRAVVNKNVTEAQLYETAERVFSRGWKRMKLYFMIGLPTEEDDDVLGIARIGIESASIGRKAAGGRVDVTVSVSTHVPKPHTPFQWAAMDSLAEIERKQRMLSQEVRPHRPVKLRSHDARGSVLEGILARGDRRLADCIERAWSRGARFDSWDDQLKLEVWEEALSHFGVDETKYLRTLPVAARLPWSHIDVGLEDGFLLREYRQSLRGRLSPPCGKVAGRFIQHTNLEEAEADRRKLVCYDCGVACDMTQMRSERLVYLDRLGAKRATPKPAAPPPEAEPVREKARVGDPNAGHRYRLRFEKLGPVALLGHLDLVRELPRVFRRLDVEQVYTGGFRPKPEMTFAPALSLGVMSLDEYVDLRLERHFDDVGLPKLLADMNAASPVGLRFVDGVRLGPMDRGVSKLVSGARYLIGLSADVVAQSARAQSAGTQSAGSEHASGATAEAWLAARCEALMQAEELPVRRRTKGIWRTIDVRRVLRALRPAAASPTCSGEELARAGIHGELLVVEVLIDITPTGSAKVAEVAQLLLAADEPPPHCAVRAELFGVEDGALLSPLDLAATRGSQQTLPVAP